MGMLGDRNLIDSQRSSLLAVALDELESRSRRSGAVRPDMEMKIEHES